MSSHVRCAVLLLGLLSAHSAHAEAQDPQIEVRIDALSFERSRGASTLQLRVPGAAAVALYLNDVVALESRLLGFSRTQRDGNEAFPSFTETNLSAAIFLPVHFGRSSGRSGLFLAPGIIVNRSSFSSDDDVVLDPESRTTMNFGLDLGFKHSLKGRVSWRHALTYRTGDDLPETVGVASGISIFFR